MCPARQRFNKGKLAMLKRLINQENLIAVLLFILIVLLVVLTTDAAPTFIYQQF
jgi:hypothetical protein